MGYEYARQDRKHDACATRSSSTSPCTRARMCVTVMSNLVSSSSLIICTVSLSSGEIWCGCASASPPISPLGTAARIIGSPLAKWSIIALNTSGLITFHAASSSYTKRYSTAQQRIVIVRSQHLRITREQFMYARVRTGTRRQRTYKRVYVYVCFSANILSSL